LGITGGVVFGVGIVVGVKFGMDGVEADSVAIKVGVEVEFGVGTGCGGAILTVSAMMSEITFFSKFKREERFGTALGATLALAAVARSGVGIVVVLGFGTLIPK